MKTSQSDKSGMFHQALQRVYFNPSKGDIMTNSTKKPRTEDRLIINIPSEHINLAMIKSAKVGVYSFNAYVRSLIEKDIDRRRRPRR